MMTEAEWMCTFMCPEPEIDDEEETLDDRAESAAKEDNRLDRE